MAEDGAGALTPGVALPCTGGSGQAGTGGGERHPIGGALVRVRPHSHRALTRSRGPAAAVPVAGCSCHGQAPQTTADWELFKYSAIARITGGYNLFELF